MLCDQFARHAVHAAMAGKTDVLIGHVSSDFVHVPIQLMCSQRRRMSLEGQLWSSVLAATGQPRNSSDAARSDCSQPRSLALIDALSSTPPALTSTPSESPPVLRGGAGGCFSPSNSPSAFSAHRHRIADGPNVGFSRVAPVGQNVGHTGPRRPQRSPRFQSERNAESEEAPPEYRVCHYPHLRHPCLLVRQVISLVSETQVQIRNHPDPCRLVRQVNKFWGRPTKLSLPPDKQGAGQSGIAFLAHKTLAPAAQGGRGPITWDLEMWVRTSPVLRGGSGGCFSPSNSPSAFSARRYRIGDGPNVGFSPCHASRTKRGTHESSAASAISAFPIRKECRVRRRTPRAPEYRGGGCVIACGVQGGGCVKPIA